MAAQLKTHARTISELSDQFTWQKKVSTVILLHWEKKSTLSADSAEEKLKNQKAEMLNNFAEVAVSRVTDQLTTDLIKAASQDVANVMQHKCDGMTFFSPFIQMILKISKFQNEFMKSSFLPKIVKISALHTTG